MLLVLGGGNPLERAFQDIFVVRLDLGGGFKKPLRLLGIVGLRFS